MTTRATITLPRLLPQDLDDLDEGTRRLVGHEFAHAIQQRRESQSSAALSARDVAELESEANRAAEAFLLGREFDITGRAPRRSHLFDGRPQPEQGAGIPFLVSIDRILDRDQLLLEFIKQYRQVKTVEDAEKLRGKEDWHWLDEAPTVTENDVENGYVLITIRDASIKRPSKSESAQRLKYFKRLSPAEQAALNAQTDEEFWGRTRYRVGQQLGKSAADKDMADTWRLLRDELIRKRQVLDALPADIRAFMLDEQAPRLEPKDFDAALRISRKVSSLAPAELAEYKSRVTAKTTDWGAYEQSIDRFLAERNQRGKNAEERRTIETRLYHLEALYERYRQYKSLLKQTGLQAAMGASSPEALGASLGAQPTLNGMRAQLEADLKTGGFPGGISEFEKLIGQYEAVFERETLAIAEVMLDQYAHRLFEQEESYRQSSKAADLHMALSASQVERDYARAETLDQEIAAGAATPDGILLPPDALKARERSEALGRAESKMARIATEHPLVGNQDFDREKLARASSKGDVQSRMLSYIADRKADIESTRRHLKSTPAMVYGLDNLLKASCALQNIHSGTVYEKIIRDHIQDVHLAQVIPQVVLGVVAIAAGLLSGGTGTVAVLATGTVLGIGAYQAIDEFRRYERQSAAYGAQLTSDDPSVAWVIVAVIGAGFDAAAFASALPKLRPAIEAFNLGPEAGNVLSLEEKLSRLTGVEEGIVQSVVRGARVEAEARAAWRSVFRPPAQLRMVLIPLAEEFGRLVYAVYLSFRRGVREFQTFVKTNEAIGLIGDVAKLTPEELATLKTGYLEAIEEMKAVAARGESLGMTENEVRAFMNLRAKTKNMSVADLTAQMDAWKATQATGVPFAFESAEKFDEFRSLVNGELKRLLKKVDSKAEAYLQGSSISGISYKRHLPFGAESDLDIAIVSRPLFKKAEKLEYQVSLSPRRIGPLAPDQVEELGLGRLKRRVEEATGSVHEAKFLLFENADAVRKPIGSESQEAERASVLLKGE